VVHEVQDTGAVWLTRRLATCAAASGVAVRQLSVPALMGGVRWQLRVQTHGSACVLEAPGFALDAGDAPAGGWPRARLAGVVNRCGPVALPDGVGDADYKSAEWSALLMAWLHGLPCPVVNRPSARQLNAVLTSMARWRQAVAAAGLPIWPLLPAGAAPGVEGPSGPGLLVVGDTCFEPVDGAAGAGWPTTLHRAAAAAAARQGCDLLAWVGARDAQGTWRVGGATAWPDLRPFGLPAVQALAGVLAGSAAAAASAA
jgi:hypothetical protein